MRRVLTKRRRERRRTVLLMIGMFACSVAYLVVDISNAAPWAVGFVLGTWSQMLLASGALDVLRLSNAKRDRWLRQSTRMTRDTLDTLKGANATNASLIDNVRRWQALFSGRKESPPKEWKH